MANQEHLEEQREERTVAILMRSTLSSITSPPMILKRWRKWR